MIYYGEVRIYVGGRVELEVWEGLLLPVWVPGRMMLKSRYQNKSERKQIIKKAKEVFGDIEVGIIPDIVSAEEDEE